MFGKSARVQPAAGSLRSKISDHNRYNGFVFSAVEFGAVAVVTAALALYFAAAGRWAAAVVALGLAVNCAPVVVMAVRARLRGEAQVGFAGLASGDVRRQIRRDRPHLLRDTVTIAVLTLIPYAAALRLSVERRTA